MKKERGFTLIEVLAALMILGLALAVLMPIFSEDIHRAYITEADLAATTLARSLLDEAEGEGTAVVGVQTGSFVGRFHWHRDIEVEASQSTDEKGLVVPYRISVDVYWTDGPGRRSVTLSGLILRPKESGK